MLAGRGVGPLAGEAGTAEADEERPPAGAVEISRHPVAAVLAAVREIAPADGFGVGAERGGDAGGGRQFVLHAGPPSNPCGTPDTGRPPLWAAQEGRRAAHRAGAAPERISLGIGGRKKAGTEGPAKVGREETKRRRPIARTGISDPSSISAGAAAPVSPATAGSACAGASLPFGLSRNWTRPAGDQQDLGREPVAVLVGLRPAPRLQLAVDVDQPALGGVLDEHVDQPVLEGDDPVPLGLVDLVAGLAVDVALVGRDAQIGDAAAAHELVDGDVGAEAADQLDPVESECHGVSPSWTG